MWLSYAYVTGGCTGPSGPCIGMHKWKDSSKSRKWQKHSSQKDGSCKLSNKRKSRVKEETTEKYVRVKNKETFGDVVCKTEKMKFNLK